MYLTEFTEYQTRQRLLSQLQAQKQSLLQAIEKFYSQHARNEAGALQALEEMIAAI